MKQTKPDKTYLQGKYDLKQFFTKLNSHLVLARLKQRTKLKSAQ